MNDINEMPQKCQYCPYWEMCEYPWVCPDTWQKDEEPIQPTRNQLENDCISRHGVSAWLDNMGYPKLADVVMDEKRFPPVQPEQTWILCSEKLPEYGEAVLTVNEDGDYEVNHIIDEDNGEWFYEGAIAWMTLPPYKEG